MATLAWFKSQLPAGFIHEITDFCEFGKNGTYLAIPDPDPAKSVPFDCTIRVSIKTADEAKQWKKSFEDAFSCRYIVRNTHPRSNLHPEFSVDYECHHSNKNKRVKSDDPKINAMNEKRYKATACKAQMKIRIKNDTRNTRYKDQFCSRGLFGVVSLFHTHNHYLSTDAVTRKLAPKTSVKDSFMSSFKEGLTVKQALDKYYMGKAATDQNDMPLHRLYTWFSEYRREEFGDLSYSEEFYAKLEERKKEFAKEDISLEYTAAPFAACIITPMMKRAHKFLPQSCETVFMDSTSAVDAQNNTITPILMNSPIGAMPLALLITQDQTTESYTAGLRLIGKIIEDNGEKAFYGKGYPSIVMRDKSAAEKAAIEAVWPNSVQMLCVFHVKQAVWRWLHNGENGISQQDRQTIMKLFSAVVDAPNSNAVVHAHMKLHNKCTELDCEKFVDYFQKNWWGIRLEWVTQLRKEPQLRGHQTNNFSEATMMILKDQILQRLCQFNAISLINELVDRMTPYYEKRCHNFCTGTSAERLMGNFMKKAEYLTVEMCQLVDNNTYKVKSGTSDVYYYVYTDVGVCTCRQGEFGAFCKHQAGVTLLHKTALPNMPPVTEEHKQLVWYIAYGETRDPQRFRGIRPQHYTEESRLNFPAPLFPRNHDERENSPQLAEEMEETEDHILVDRQPQTGYAEPRDPDLLAGAISNEIEGIIGHFTQIEKDEPKTEEFLKALKKLRRQTEIMCKSRQRATVIHQMAAYSRSAARSKKILVNVLSVSRRTNKHTGGGRARCSKRGRPPKSTQTAKKAQKKSHNFAQNLNA